ncbi:MAG: hypothetical protein WC547_03300 [Candidatus Omnitrophota bacterium]
MIVTNEEINRHAAHVAAQIAVGRSAGNIFKQCFLAGRRTA